MKLEKIIVRGVLEVSNIKKNLNSMSIDLECLYISKKIEFLRRIENEKSSINSPTMDGSYHPWRQRR